LHGANRFFKDENNACIKTGEQQDQPEAPVPAGQAILKLQQLWSHLSENTRLSALRVAVRILQGNLAPEESEVAHDHS